MAAKAKKAAKRKPLGKSQMAFAKHIDVSKQRVSQFVSDGTFPVLEDGALDEDVCRIIYLRWLRGEGRKSAKTAATSRHQDAKVREIELRIAREESELVSKEDALFVMDQFAAAVTSEFGNLPARLSRDIAERARLQRSIEDAMKVVADKMAECWAGLVKRDS